MFNFNMLPHGNVTRRHGFNFHSYADDTQLYIAASPDGWLLWMTEYFLQLSEDKTKV